MTPPSSRPLILSSETEINKAVSSRAQATGVDEEPRGDCRRLGKDCGTGMGGCLGTKEQQAGLHSLCQTLVGGGGGGL